MYFSPITYHEPVFRPPGEAFSAIIQATIGCSWNKCAFCEMYTSKKFRIRKFEEIQSDIKMLVQADKRTKKIFLADGNAFALKPDKLIRISDEINMRFQRVQRISSYALPKDILNKTCAELKSIRKAGLKLLYIGIETGDDELLSLVNKGETFATTLDGITKAHDAGFDTSVMIITGLGGKKYSRQHAINSAKLINRINPKFLSTLTLSMPLGQDHFIQKFNGQYIQQSSAELALELKLFLEQLELENSIFRSDHISNEIVLKGVLSKDKRKLIETIDNSLSV